MKEQPPSRWAAIRRRRAAWGSGSPARKGRKRCRAQRRRSGRPRSGVSTKNWRRMDLALAPTALRTPISRVRSRTATSITFITPMPPRNKRGQPHGAQKILHAVDQQRRKPWHFRPCPRWGLLPCRSGRNCGCGPARGGLGTCTSRVRRRDFGVTSRRSIL